MRRTVAHPGARTLRAADRVLVQISRWEAGGALIDIRARGGPARPGRTVVLAGGAAGIMCSWSDGWRGRSGTAGAGMAVALMSWTATSWSCGMGHRRAALTTAVEVICAPAAHPWSRPDIPIPPREGGFSEGAADLHYPGRSRLIALKMMEESRVEGLLIPPGRHLPQIGPVPEKVVHCAGDPPRSASAMLSWRASSSTTFAWGINEVSLYWAATGISGRAR